MAREDYKKDNLPVVTNRINVTFDDRAFHERYTIVSYFSEQEKHNLPYENLAETKFISVTGIRARWNDDSKPSVRFFILVEKGGENEVMKSLRQYDHIVAKIDDLHYGQRLRQRIIASLAINSLGTYNGHMMYNGGDLYIRDDRNFLAPKSRKELVCLKISVNEYLVLAAETKSFSHPRDIKSCRTCVFRVANDVEGDLWSGQAVRPVVIKKDSKEKYDPDELFVIGKRFRDTRNSVPYWPYNKDNYTHGRLFALWQVVKLVNEKYAGLVRIDFSEFPVAYYTDYKSGKDALALLAEYMSGKRLYFIDEFNTPDSQSKISQIKDAMQEFVNGRLIFSKSKTDVDMVVKLCEKEDEEVDASLYSKGIDRFGYGALQHVTFSPDKKDDEMPKAQARRILLELMVKDWIAKGKASEKIAGLTDGWRFIRYRLNNGSVHGAALKIQGDGVLSFTEYGMSQNMFGENFETFVNEQLKFHKPNLLWGARDYMALEKGGNVYMIIDANEIPILNAELIDEGYGLVFNENEKISMFKRVKVAHKYLRAYIGFHLWKCDGLEGEPEGAYSYISGINLENIQIHGGTKMDRMPRARKIFILHKERPDAIDGEIMEIQKMLQFGLGRWNELMTYPFPFKLLYEYLDNACELAFSLHWDKITSKAVL